MVLIRRFQRDAYGAARFHRFTENLRIHGDLKSETRIKILEQVKGLGIRITAENPRKTRIAAAFSLWMCTIRPVCADNLKLPTVTLENLEQICARLNFWMATTYLGKFGVCSFGEGDDSIVRLKHVVHDFMCRDINLSSLELLYAGLFRPKESVVNVAEKEMATPSP